MNIKSFVVDGFYENVDEVRNLALSQSFEVTGNYPGNRTKSFATKESRDAIESIVTPSLVRLLIGQKDTMEHSRSQQRETGPDSRRHRNNMGGCSIPNT